MIFIAKSIILVDQPTPGGSIYPRNLVERAIKRFNSLTATKQIRGSVLDRSDILRLGDPTHVARRVYIDDDSRVCAELDTINNIAGWQIVDKLEAGCEFAAVPIICIPDYINILRSTSPPVKVDKINSVVRIQIEEIND